jgi:hypothetical protein
MAEPSIHGYATGGEATSRSGRGRRRADEHRDDPPGARGCAEPVLAPRGCANIVIDPDLRAELVGDHRPKRYVAPEEVRSLA